MAILERSTNNYYKIDFDECMIKGTSIIVAFSTYKTTEDREKEKARRPFLNEFLNNVQQRLTTLYNELISGCEALGKNPEEIIDSNGVILEAYPELRAKQAEMNALESMQQAVFVRFYQYGDNILPQIEYSVSKKLLEGYGYNESWITDPIRLTTKAQIYCGEYNGETIGYEFYYNKLKERMNDSIEDC
ncbi:MAG: hypothetical protein EOM87_10490 [Clostridia bacterium]|nr:hypothetical protein [Clostridia bacterium]